jgi:hypothetical protein
MNNLRKIESSEEQERKRKRNTLFLSIIMIGILVFSTAGYFSFSGNDDSGNANGDVQNMGDSWVFKYGEQTIKLSYSPEEVKNITLLINEDISSYADKTVYVASESDAGLYEIYPAMSNAVGRIQEACYGNCTKDLPEKDCSETMIVIKPANVTERVYQKDSCVFIEGDLKAVDAFLYKIYGMI